MASQNLGTLTVELNAESKKFLSGMASAAAGVEKFAKETKKLANDVAQVSGALLLLGGAAVKMAADVDGPAGKAVADLKKSMQLLAVQIADVLLPAVRAMSEWFKKAADFIAGLDPHLKQQIAVWAEWIAGIAVAAKVIGTVMGLFDGVAGALSSLFKAMSAVGIGPLLGIAAAIAGIVALVIVMHRAWRQNWGGIQQVVENVFNNIGDAVKWLAEMFSGLWKSVIQGAKSFVMSLLDVVDALQDLSGRQLIDTAGMREGFDGLFKDLQSGSFFSGALDFAKSTATDLANTISEEVAIIKKELMGAFGGMGGGGKTIGLGRGLGGGGSSGGDRSGHSAMADMSMMAIRSAEVPEAASSPYQNDISGMSAVADMSMAVAEEASARAAESAKKQAENAKVAAEASAKMKQKITAMAMSMVQSTTGVLGAVGNLINTAMSAAQSGGPWAAFVAVIMEIVKETASAMEFVGVAMNFVKEIAKMIEPLVKPIFDALQGVLGQIMEAIGPLFVSLQPLMNAVAKLIGDLAPIFSAIGDLVSALGPLLEWVGKVVGVVFDTLKPVFELISGIIRVIATTIMGIIIFLNSIAAAFGDENAKKEIKKMEAEIERMWDPNREARDRADQEAATATIRNANAQDKAAEAATKLAESLTNVPSGYKMALARYNATGEGAYDGVGSMPGSGRGGSGGGGTTVINVAGNVNIDNSAAADAGELGADIAKEAKKERGQRVGNTTRID